jgi:hypothetical protein
MFRVEEASALSVLTELIVAAFNKFDFAVALLLKI